MPWEPDLAAPDLEKLMEARDLPGGDRDEVRRFAEVLRRRREKREGLAPPPLPPEVGAWLLGRE